MLLCFFLSLIIFSSLSVYTPLTYCDQNNDEISFISVAYDPNVKDYQDEEAVSTLVKEALRELYPNHMENPLSNLIKQGDVVVLKPNLVSSSGLNREGCTRTPILRPIIELAVNAGASAVVIAEGPAGPNWDDEVFHEANIAILVNEMQA